MCEHFDNSLCNTDYYFLFVTDMVICQLILSQLLDSIFTLHWDGKIQYRTNPWEILVRLFTVIWILY